MKKKIYLHIGTFKTGTSSIQQYLYDNKSELKEQGLLYPTPIISGGGQHELPLSLIKENSSFRANWPEFNCSSSEAWDRVVDEIESSECDRTIISSEFFCDLAHPEAATGKKEYTSTLRRYLAPYDVKIICYLRDPITYLKSMYGEILKTSCMTTEYQDFLWEQIQTRNFHANPLILLDYYSDIFGKDRIVTRHYDRLKLLDCDAITDFLSIFGIRKNSPTIETNESIPWKSLLLKRAFNIGSLNDLDSNKKISELLISTIKINNQQSTYKNHKIIDKLKENISELNQAYGTNLRIPTPSELLNEESCTDTELFSSALFGLLMRQNLELIATVNEHRATTSALMELVNKERLELVELRKHFQDGRKLRNLFSSIIRRLKH